MTAKGKPLDRYWDSAAMPGLSLDEADRADDCRTVIKATQEGRVRIVTSALTLTEVVALKGYKPLPADGTRIAFQHRRGPTFDIDVINADGSGLRQLISDPVIDAFPA